MHRRLNRALSKAEAGASRAVCSEAGASEQVTSEVIQLLVVNSHAGPIISTERSHRQASTVEHIADWVVGPCVSY